jgi:hypothetical protein
MVIFVKCVGLTLLIYFGGPMHNFKGSFGALACIPLNVLHKIRRAQNQYIDVV